MILFVFSQLGKVCHLNIKTGTLSKRRELHITFVIVLIKELLTLKSSSYLLVNFSLTKNSLTKSGTSFRVQNCPTSRAGISCFQALKSSYSFFLIQRRTQDSQKQPPDVLCKQKCSYKFRKIHRKALAPETSFNKVTGIRHRCFPATFAKYLKTPIYRKPPHRCFWILPSTYTLFFIRIKVHKTPPQTSIFTKCSLDLLLK